jgi:hypothetical protein
VEEVCVFSTRWLLKLGRSGCDAGNVQAGGNLRDDEDNRAAVPSATMKQDILWTRFCIAAKLFLAVWSSHLERNM